MMRIVQWAKKSGEVGHTFTAVKADPPGVLDWAVKSDYEEGSHLTYWERRTQSTQDKERRAQLAAREARRRQVEHTFRDLPGLRDAEARFDDSTPCVRSWDYHGRKAPWER